MAGGSTESGRSVTSRVTAILLVLRAGGAESLTELAGLAGLPVSTAHRLVGELVAQRLVERTPDGGYRPGLPLRIIGAAAPEPGSAAVLERAAAVMTDVAAATGATVLLGQWDGSTVVSAVVEPGGPVSPPAPDRYPPDASALGRVLLAFSPPDMVDAVLAGTAEPDRVRRALAATRLTLVAVSRWDAGTRRGVAVPVFGSGGAMLAALEAVPAPGAGGSGLAGARGALVVAAGSLSRRLATLPHEAWTAPRA